MSDLYLQHHGIKGQKWGVRRFQDKNGRLTEAGRKQLYYRNRVIRNMKTTDAVNGIVKSLTKKERSLLGASENEDWISKDQEVQVSSIIAKRFIQSYNDTPVSMLEIYDNGNYGEIAIATKNDDQYRGKGLASKNVQKAIKWYESQQNKTLDELYWFAAKENTASNNLAKKSGFKEVNYKDTKFYKKKNEPLWEDWNIYSYKKN